MKKWKALGLTAILSTAILAACGDGENEAASADEQDKVLQYQVQAGVVHLPEVAQALGYFEDIELESVGNYVGGPESIQLVATGQTDYGRAFTGAVLKSESKGVNITSVMGGYGSDKYTATSLYVLEDSGIETAEDLIGKDIGINTLGAHYEFFLNDYLRQNGLSEEQIKEIAPVIIPLANTEQMLRNGQVDAVVMNGLPRDLALERGGIKMIASDIEVYGRDFIAGPLFFSDDYIEENPDTVRQFVEGSAKALEWLKATPREEVIELYSEILTARGEEAAVENTRFYESPGIAAEGGLLVDEDFTIFLETLEANGTIEEGSVNVKDMYTNEFNPYNK
ncbi:ABC transporter substrate-binding protein [Caryophanon tenue]|uniref:Thiamine pyrimidine synthase n=1 Tax=Caryophanon tenue TaxID=33978 RepID=A0A1C0Y8L3_9BACL|nr:ABC transporter substrate-binding protein [Caryophanon tenue]OCS83491.1 ABC transporter substrate-binding protein [Caryophanon tenue]